MATDAALLFSIDSKQALKAAKDLEVMGKAAVKVAGDVNKFERSASSLTKVLGNRREQSFFFSDAQISRAQSAMSGYNRTLENTSSKVIASRAAFSGAASSANNFAAAQNAAAMQSSNVFAQLNDIGVMLAAGQNPFQLAMQQGTQLNQVWASMGAQGKTLSGVAGVLGSAFSQMINPMSLLTIGVIAGAGALVNWATSSDDAAASAKSASDAMSDFTSVTDSFRQALVNADAPWETLIDKFGMQAQKAGELYDVMLRVEKIEFMRGVADTVSALDEQFSGVENTLRRIDDLRRQGEGYNDIAINRAIEKLRNDTGLAEGQARDLLSVINQLGNTNDPAVLAEKFTRVTTLLVTAKEGGADVSRELIRIAKEAGLSAAAIHELTGALGAAAATAAQIKIPVGFTPEYGDNSGVTGVNSGLLSAYGLDIGSGSGRGGGGRGGGGGTDQYASNLQRLVDSLKTQDETVTAWYEANQAILNDRRAQEILGIQAHNDLKIALENEYQSRLDAIIQQERSVRLGEYSDMFSGLAGIAQAGGNRLLKIHATLSAASTLISAYDTAMKAAAEAVTPAGRIAAYAKFLGIGLNAVAQIKKAGGSGGGASGMSASSASSTANANPSRYLTINLHDVSSRDAGMIEPIITEIVERIADGQVVLRGVNYQ